MNLRAMFNRGLVRAFPHLQKRLEMASAYQQVFDGPQGQRVLRDIIQASGFLNEDIEPLSSHDALYRAGRRSLAAHIMTRLRWSEGELLQLGQEITYEELMAREQIQEQAA